MADILTGKPVDAKDDASANLHGDAATFPPSGSGKVPPAHIKVEGHEVIPPAPSDGHGPICIPIPPVSPVSPHSTPTDSTVSLLSKSTNVAQVTEALSQQGYTPVPETDKGQVSLKPGDVLIGERKSEIKPGQTDHRHMMMYAGMVDGKPTIFNYDGSQNGAGLKLEPLNKPMLSEVEQRYGYSSVTVLRAPAPALSSAKEPHENNPTWVAQQEQLLRQKLGLSNSADAAEVTDAWINRWHSETKAYYNLPQSASESQLGDAMLKENKGWAPLTPQDREIEKLMHESDNRFYRMEYGLPKDASETEINAAWKKAHPNTPADADVYHPEGRLDSIRQQYDLRTPIVPNPDKPK